jgi:hypothetical protein
VIGALVALATVVAVGLATGGGEDDALPPTSTVAVSSTVVHTNPGSVTAPVHSGVLSGSVTTSAVTATTSAALADRPQGYTWVSFGRADMTLIDLDTGERSTYPSPERTAGGAESPIAFGDRVLYTSYDLSPSGQTPSVWSQTLGADRPVRLVERAVVVVASTRPGHVWIQPRMAAVENYEAVEIDLTGHTVTTLTIAAGLRVAGASANGLWLVGSGRILEIDRSGVVREIAEGALIDTSPDAVLYHDCPLAGPCTVRAANATREWHIGSSATLDRASTHDGSDSMMSPDGRWLLTARALFDRTTSSSVAHSFELRSWRWSADGEWLFVSSANTDSIAWNLRDLRQVSLGVLGLLSGVVIR